MGALYFKSMTIKEKKIVPLSPNVCILKLRKKVYNYLGETVRLREFTGKKILLTSKKKGDAARATTSWRGVLLRERRCGRGRARPQTGRSRIAPMHLR